MALATVATVIVLFAAVLPLIDGLIDHPRRGVPAGTALEVRVPAERAIVSDAPGHRTVRFVPASGWSPVEEPDASTSSIELVQGGISFELSADHDVTGDCAGALDAREDDLRSLDGSGRRSEAQTFSTDNGQVGLAASFVGTRVEGLLVVVCERGAVATVVVSGPVGALQGDGAEPALDMARSIDIR